MGIFQPTMLYYRRLSSFPVNKTTWKTSWPAPASMGRSADHSLRLQCWSNWWVFHQPIWKMCASQIGSFPPWLKIPKMFEVMLRVSDASSDASRKWRRIYRTLCCTRFSQLSSCLHRLHFCSRHKKTVRNQRIHLVGNAPRRMLTPLIEYGSSTP